MFDMQHMTKHEAMKLLDQVQKGYPATIAKINEALLKTGDIDLFVDRKQHNRIYSGQEIKPEKEAVVSLSHAIKYWAADRKA